MKFAVLLLLSALLAGAQQDAGGELGDKLTELSRGLGDARFEKREEALAAVRQVVASKKEQALPHLRKLWKNESDPEIRTRLLGLGREMFLQTKGSLFGFTFLPGQPLAIDGRRCLSISVESVLAGHPAEQAGLKVGDLIYGANDRLLNPTHSLDEVRAFFKFLPPDEVHQLRVRRDGQDLRIKVRPLEQDLSPSERRQIERQFFGWFSGQ